ncbi:MULTISPECIES: ferredoxin [Amycolatopsis]|uniref:Ferredoxin n=1 Tax=Amycolatopsis albidoflavus TaxID=102226 RepID=A0ABW5I988_9PSEU
MSELRTDNRLDDVPMQPLRCQHCAARLLVRKSTVHQTSLQWNAEAVEACAELGASPMPGPALAGCSRLKESLEAEVAAGRLRIVQTV